jgi:hypothetical protein
MSFESFVVAVSGFLYFCVSISYFLKGRYDWSFVWLCYSMANVGLIMAAKNKGY